MSASSRSSRSHRANHYGTAVEYWAADEYRFDLARSSWKDAEFSNGVPVEIKSAMHQHADGQPGTFKLYSDAHRKLRRHDGYYCFAVYTHDERCAADTRVLDAVLRHSSRLPRLSWHGGGEHRGMQQAKLSIEEVF